MLTEPSEIRKSSNRSDVMVRYIPSDYISRFPETIQNRLRAEIRNRLKASNGGACSEDDVERRMNGRLSEIEDLVDTRKWLKMANGKA